MRADTAAAVAATPVDIAKVASRVGATWPAGALFTALRAANHAIGGYSCRTEIGPDGQTFLVCWYCPTPLVFGAGYANSQSQVVCALCRAHP